MLLKHRHTKTPRAQHHLKFAPYSITSASAALDKLHVGEGTVGDAYDWVAKLVSDLFDISAGLNKDGKGHYLAAHRLLEIHDELRSVLNYVTEFHSAFEYWNRSDYVAHAPREMGVGYDWEFDCFVKQQ